jgi:hypothetical protein
MDLFGSMMGDYFCSVGSINLYLLIVFTLVPYEDIGE